MGKSRSQAQSAGITQVLDEILARGEIGIDVAAYLGNRLVLEARAGVMDEASGHEVDEQTLFPVFSVTKAVALVALHLQAERGAIEYDARVADYWPEFGNRGKERVTVQHVLWHRAGVPAMPLDVTPERLQDWDWMVERLAAMEPAFEPGTQNAYLSYTFGWLVGELVRRTDPMGRSFSRFVQEEICAPLRLDALWIGLPPEHEGRVATLTYPELPAAPVEGLRARATPSQIFFTPELYNRADIHQACIPASNGIANARSVARLFAMLANRGELDGVRLLSEERVLSFLEPRPDFLGMDAVYGKVQPIGAGGFHLHAQGVISRELEDRRILCHIGAGSSLGWADLDSGLAFAICHNRMAPYTPESPYPGLGEAVIAAASERVLARGGAAALASP
ncbi:MAG: serine hydrolase domain-containing protein [Burkholderiales bacterium]